MSVSLRTASTETAIEISSERQFTRSFRKLISHINGSEWRKISVPSLRIEVWRSLNIWPTLATQKRLLSLLSKNLKKVTVVTAFNKTSLSFILLCRLFKKVSSQSPNNFLLQPISQLNLWKRVSLHYVWALSKKNRSCDKHNVTFYTCSCSS